MKSQIVSVGCCLGLLASAAVLAQSGLPPAPGYGYGAPQMPYAPPGPEGAAPYGYPGAGAPPPGAYPGAPPPPIERSERGSGNPMERMMAPMGKMSEPAGQMAKPMGRMMDPMREMMPGGDRSESRAPGGPPGYGQPPQVGPGGYGYPPAGPPAERESKNPMGQMMAPMGKMMEPMKNVMGAEKKTAPEGYGAPPPYPYGPAGGPAGYGYAPGTPMPPPGTVDPMLMPPATPPR